MLYQRAGVNNRTGFLYAAQGRYVSEVAFDGDYARAYRVWTAPIEGDRDAPAYDVNAVAVDATTGDLFAAISAQKIYRLHLDQIWNGTLFAGKKDLSYVLGGMDFPRDGPGSQAEFHSISAMAFDLRRDILYVSDFRTLRAVARDGSVSSVAGGCQRQTAPRYRGEFTCDYPPNDGNGMNAHFSWPITGLAVNSRRGALAILNDAEVKRMDASRNVVTIAGNRRSQPQHEPLAWDGRYLDTASGETLDVYVHGDNEVEVFADHSGRVFDVRHGLRSLALGPAEFWNADSYVRIGASTPGTIAGTAIGAPRCGDFHQYVRSNPDREPFFTRWYGSPGREQTARYFKSSRCVATRITDDTGRVIYEDVESTVIRHYVPSGLTEYPDQRFMYHG